MLSRPPGNEVAEVHTAVLLSCSLFLLISACDQCRKTKSKCERSLDGGPCKSCALVGTGQFQLISLTSPSDTPFLRQACTYLGASIFLNLS